jgi:kynurenine formamidase
MPSKPTRESLEKLFEQVKNWGRWGAEDERGALNYITPALRARAARLIQDGELVSCSLDFPVLPAPDNPHPALHMMTMAGDACTVDDFGGLQQTADFIGISFHGMASSHIDALCHIMVDGRMYNGFVASEVRSTGAQRNSIMAAKDGIAGRGVLLDIPALKGVEWLELGHAIGIEDLEAAEQAQSLRVGEGDVLLVSTGRHARRERHGPWDFREGLAGLHAECVSWLHERRIAVLGCDGISDVIPGPGIPGWPTPIHQCGIAGIGLHLLDNLDLRGLSAACARRRRWEFFYSVAPLRVARGTGSPVNPLAIF